MPTLFPHKDPATGELTDVTYYSAGEVAARIHVSSRTVWRQCAAARWPHIRVAGRYYLNADHIERVIELMTVDPDQIPTWEPNRALGVVVDGDDIEGVQ